MWILSRLVPLCVNVNKRDRCPVAMYSHICRKNWLHGEELTLIPFLFFVVGVIAMLILLSIIIVVVVIIIIIYIH